MKSQLIIAIKFLGIMIVLLGIAYPLFITGIAQTCFHWKANGSLIENQGKIIGSELIGQQFDDPAYFHSRPSTIGYNPLPSGASNLGLMNPTLKQQASTRKAKFILENNLSEKEKVPAEMVFASASGLDPHISPEAAFLQVNRIAETRKFSDNQKQELYTWIEQMSGQSGLYLFGSPRVNVLLLNMALDQKTKE